MARTGGSKKNEPFAVRSTPSALGLMKLKPKVKTKSTWKPLDLAENETSDTSASPAAAETETSQDEAETASAASGSQVLAPIRAPLGPPTDMAGSNAKFSDKDEIVQEFGHKLAESVWLRANTGKHDGELRFIQHPNRDVTAHIWSDEQFEWVQIGLYSISHRVMHGFITSDRYLDFVGKTDRVTNSLPYFIELSKGYPRYHATRPVVSMPPLSSMQPATTSQQRPALNAQAISSEAARYDSLSSASEPYNETRLPTLASLSLRDRPATISRPIATHGPSAPQGLGTPADDPFATDSQISSKADVTSVPGSVGLRKSSTQGDSGKMDFAFRFPSTIGGLQRIEAPTNVDESDRKAFFAEQERSRAEKMRQNLAPAHTLQPKTNEISSLGKAPLEPRDHSNTGPSFPGLGQSANVASSSVLAASSAPKARAPRDSQSTQQQQMNESRARMLEYLTRIGDEKLPTLAPPETLRSVQHEKASKDMPIPGELALYEKAPSTGSQVSRTALRTSDPEPDYYENRRQNVSNTFGLGGPTPQNFQGPFFQDDFPTQNNPGAHRSARKSHDDELDEWWKSGLRTQRHDDFLKTLTRPANVTSNKAEVQPTDRLLVPLYETLASYVRVPGEPPKERDYFARYAPPPEWAIDRSRAGDRSFFGQDWGETPRRIGRDPRFQSNFSLPKYTLFEEQHEDPATRFQHGLRGSQAGPAYMPSQLYARKF